MSISDQRDESRRWTQGHPDGPRFDADGVAWFACDPYPTWYRWDDGRLVRGAPWFPKAKGGLGKRADYLEALVEAEEFMGGPATT